MFHLEHSARCSRLLTQAANPEATIMPWKNIEDLLKRPDCTLPSPYRDIFAIQIPNTGSSWLVGPYDNLTKLATALRANEDLWQTLTKLGVRLGLRNTDVPPVDERQPRYGATQTGVAFDTRFTNERVKALARPARDAAMNRLSDRKENVARYWRTQTPESHHIVEYNNLWKINASAEGRKGRRPMDHGQLPAVLLAAEYHRRYISVVLKETHYMNAVTLRTRMPGIYQSLYVGPLLDPLWRISRIILAEAGLSAP